jgi:hypothetical protein
MNYSPKLKMETIPDPILTSEYQRRLSARRTVRSGGRNGGRPMPCGNCTLDSCDPCQRKKKRLKIKLDT